MFTTLVAFSAEIGGKYEYTGGWVGKGVVVGIAACVSATSVNAAETAVSFTFDGIVVGVDVKLLQDINITPIKSSEIVALTMDFTFS